MRKTLIAATLFAVAASTSVYALNSHNEAGGNMALAKALADPGRSEANKARDKYRHPMQTLSFFGVKATDTVVELIPGGGWYTEILGPYLSAGGKLYAATTAGKNQDSLRAKIAGSPVLGKVAVVGTVPSVDEIASNSVDVVLTFRNMHNLTMAGDGSDAKVLAGVMRVLKPGGTFGVVDHRLPEARDVAAEKKSGYLKVSTVRRVVEGAGFKYVGASEINANPKDKANYPKGVWTLPPNYAEGETDKAKYAAIGESDRMTQKFVKPAK